MARIRLETGEVLNFDGEPTQEQIEDAVRQIKGGVTQQSQQDVSEGAESISEAKKETIPELGIKEGRLTPMERFSGGFRTEKDLESRRASERVALGLAEDTPLEPTPGTASLIDNLKDVPADILDSIAPAFPAVGQILGGILGGLATTPETGGVGTIPGVMAGGIAGAGIGETARQFVGEQLFGFDQGTVGERAGKVATEAAWGAAGEVGGVIASKAVRATKFGLLKSANKLLETKSVDTFAKIFGKLAPNVDFIQTEYALASLRRGDFSVMKAYLSKPDFSRKFADRLLFGKNGNLADNIAQLARTKPGSVNAIKELFGQNGFLGLPEDVIDTVIQKGSRGLSKYSDPNFIISLAHDVSEAVSNPKTGEGLIEQVGEQLAKARGTLASQAKGAGARVDLTALNSQLASHLEQVGFFRATPYGYEINKSFATTPTGRAQQKMFTDLVDRFFTRVEERVSPSQESVQGLRGTALAEALSQRPFTKILYEPKNDLHYSSFVKKLANIDVQISGNEFGAMGKLSPDLTIYLRGLRQFPKDIADRVGNKEVGNLTQEFERLIETFNPIREAAASKDYVTMEKFFTSMSKPDLMQSIYPEVLSIDEALSKKGVRFIDSLKSYNASNVIKDFDSPLRRGSEIDKVERFMKGIFKETTGGRTNAIESYIDPYLPKGYQIVKTARDHVVAENLHKDSIALLRARFLGNAALQPLVGGTIGAIAGGPVGAAIGATATLGGGMVLQNPTLFRNLLRFAAKRGGKQIPITAGKTIPREAIIGSTQLLKELIGNNK